MLNIWKDAVQVARATDLENPSRSGEKRKTRTQEEVRPEETRSLKRVRITEEHNLETLLNELQRHNFIVQNEEQVACITTCSRVLDFFNNFEKKRVTACRRISIVLVRDDSSVKTYESNFREIYPKDIKLDIGVYNPSKANSNQWENLTRKDVIIADSHAFLDSLKHNKLSLSQVHTLIISDGEHIRHLSSDPIVQIVTGFYHVADDIARPRILAVVNHSTPDVDLHLSELEKLLDASIFRLGRDQEQESARAFILDPTTSCRLHPADSPGVLDRVVTELKRVETPVNFTYAQAADGSTICTVVLPPGLPFQRISGTGCQSRTDARVSACYQACQELSTRGLLDYQYFPLSEMSTLERNPAFKSSSDTDLTGKPKKSGVRSYPRQSPDFWINTLHTTTSGQLYPTVIIPQQKGDQLSPIVLLTRLPLPQLPSFELFFSGAATRVCFQKGNPFFVEDEKFEDLRKYTLRLFRMIGNKPFVCDLRSMPYLLAPLASSWINFFDQHSKSLWDLPDVASHIPWSAVTFAASKAFVHMKTDSIQSIEEELKDAVIQDRWVEYTRRYFALRIKYDMSPLHKPSEEERESGYETYFAYCQARVSGFTGLKNPTTPLVEVETVPGLLNRLDPSLEPQLSAKGSPKYLIPELCGKSTIPASILKTALALPSIFIRIDEFLLVKQLNQKLFSNMISEQLLRAALTPPSARVDVDYERLEILGDALLKYISSAYVFVTHPSALEGDLHSHRRGIIANKTLWRSAEKTGIPQFILTTLFSAKHWYPANVTIRASFNPVSDDNMEPDIEKMPSGEEPSPVPTLEFRRHAEYCSHRLGDKTLADAIEAIIAAAYLSGGHEAIIPVLKALAIPVLEHKGSSVEVRKALPVPYPSSKSIISSPRIKELERIIGYTIEHPYYFGQVLLNTCLTGYESTCLERLEFLGDAILEFLTMKYIYEREPDLSPGALTLLKSAMVSNSTLAAMCVWSGLHQFMTAAAHTLGDALKSYASAVTIKHSEEHQVATQANRSLGQYWLDVECPKTVSDVMEATLGALYVSDKCSLVGAQKFFDTVFKPFYGTYITFKSLSRHATNTMLELLQKRGCNHYRMVKDDHVGQTRCRVIVHGSVLGEATSSAASSAMRKACELGLDVLTKDLGYLERICNCEVSKNKLPGKGPKRSKARSSIQIDM